MENPPRRTFAFAVGAIGAWQTQKKVEQALPSKFVSVGVTLAALYTASLATVEKKSLIVGGILGILFNSLGKGSGAGSKTLAIAQKENEQNFYFMDDKIHVFGEFGLVEISRSDFADMLSNLQGKMAKFYFAQGELGEFPPATTTGFLELIRKIVRDFNLPQNETFIYRNQVPS